MVSLFAQAAPPPPGMPPAAQWAVGVVCGLALLAAVGILVVAVLFLMTLSKALSRCHPDNRTMAPGLVWLNLVPCLNVVWQFVTVLQVGASLKNEFVDRRLDDGGDYGKTVGFASLLLGLVGAVVQNVPAVVAPNNPQAVIAGSGLGLLLGLGQFVLFVVYWVKIAGYGRQLLADDLDAEEAGGYDRRDDRPDDPPDNWERE